MSVNVRADMRESVWKIEDEGNSHKKVFCLDTSQDHPIVFWLTHFTPFILILGIDMNGIILSPIYSSTLGISYVHNVVNMFLQCIVSLFIHLEFYTVPYSSATLQPIRGIYHRIHLPPNNLMSSQACSLFIYQISMSPSNQLPPIPPQYP